MATSPLPNVPSAVPQEKLGQTDPCRNLLLDDTMLHRLAYELAREMYDPEDVVKLYGIDIVQFQEFIAPHPQFMAFYAEARQLWGASTNAEARVRLKAGITFEQWLREANRLMHDPTVPFAPKVEFGKVLADMAGFSRPKGGDQVKGGEGVSVVIQLGHGREIKIDKTIEAKEVAADVIMTAPAPPPPAAVEIDFSQHQPLPPEVTPPAPPPKTVPHIAPPGYKMPPFTRPSNKGGF